MQFQPQKLVMEQALADIFFHDNPSSKAISMYEELPDEVVEVFAIQGAFADQVL